MSGEETQRRDSRTKMPPPFATDRQAPVPHMEKWAGTAEGQGPSRTWPNPTDNRCRVFLLQFWNARPQRSFMLSQQWVVEVQRKANEASRVAKGQELEVEHLVELTDIAPKQARTLLRRHGADWPKLKDEAEALKKED
ncbi:hypothetical protein [Mesorhizobium sp. M7A.F.Ca.US.008.03.1.1]|uniref:hypothetical protein n=1 Tax=Mesorhizobium sp. M7A.F.Ca.US.008.03.1.1 TaxID=2496742 RepID=UPI0013DFCD62|nr:hypothetical protein [Mesorhizobium sp. M7A.F.Ca.US.008.03.1.1]